MMTLEKAKSILNKSGKDYTDQETKWILDCLYKLALLEYTLRKKGLVASPAESLH